MSQTITSTSQQFGQLAYEHCGQRLSLQVLQSAAGYYIGTCDGDGPYSRESNEYYSSRSDAQAALDKGSWTQKRNP